MEKVTDLADPRRCQQAAPDGQCRNRAEYGSNFCPAHGGRSTLEAENKRRYLLADAASRARLASLAEDDQIKSLREEIQLCRLLIERRYNLIKTDADLISGVGAINAQFQTLERLIKSCHQIEESMGTMLAKSTVIKAAQELCKIVVEELDGVENYEAIVDRVVQRVIATVQSAQNSPNAGTLAA